MRVVVLGAGAIGSVLGARLASAGHAVTLVGRPSTVRAIREHGLVVEGHGAGTYRLDAVPAPPPLAGFRAAIVAVKTFDLASALTELARAGPALPTLLVQNGLGIEATAAAAVRTAGWAAPEACLVRAVQSIPATLLEDGQVRAVGAGEIVLADPDSAGPAAPAVRTFLELFAGPGTPVRTTSDLGREVWRKVLVNAAINPVTALHGVPNGELLRSPWRDEALRLLDEARRTAAAAGVVFSREEAEADFERVVRATASNRSSMLQDLARGRPTEIDAISGEIVRRGTTAGLDLVATRRALRAVLERAGPAAQPL